MQVTIGKMTWEGNNNSGFNEWAPGNFKNKLLLCASLEKEWETCFYYRVLYSQSIFPQGSE